jgi:tetratricopeptide (TPR) repeat protein
MDSNASLEEHATRIAEVPRSRGKSLRFLLLPILFGAGIAGGSRFATKVTDSKEHAETSEVSRSEPIAESIDRLIRNREFAAALELCESEESDPEDSGIRYRWAICKENLEAWKVAVGAYKVLANSTGGEIGLYSTLGLIRCSISDHQLDVAASALARLEIVDSSHETQIAAERTRLRACLLYSGLGAVKEPDPFDPTALAWPKAVEYRNDRPVWLPPVRAGEESVPPVMAHELTGRRSTHPVAVPVLDAREHVRNALGETLASHDHPTIRLVLANLDRQDGRRNASNDQYRKIVQDDPDSPEAMMASYNLGLVYLAEGAIASAREAFFGVVDRDPGGPWGDLGRYWIGRTYLDGDDPDSARIHFRKVTGIKSRRQRAAAGFAWALARLLQNDDDGLERIASRLEPDAETLSIATNEFFVQLLRHRIRPSALRAEQLGQALEKAQNLKHLGPSGILAAGRIWIEIGLTEKAVKLFDASESDFRGPLSTKLLYASAEGWHSLGKLREARTRYLAVAALDDQELGLDAEMKLAEIDVNEGRGKDGLKRAYRVWKRRDAETDEMLRIMGRGFEQIGYHAAAAECFSGRVPRFE